MLVHSFPMEVKLNEGLQQSLAHLHSLQPPSTLTYSHLDGIHLLVVSPQCVYLVVNILIVFIAMMNNDMML